MVTLDPEDLEAIKAEITEARKKNQKTEKVKNEKVKGVHISIKDIREKEGAENPKRRYPEK